MFKSLTGLRGMVPEVSRITHLSRPVKLTALSLSLGIALIGALAMFFRRRRKRTQMIQKKLEAKNQRQQQSQNHHQYHSHPHIPRPQGILFGSGNRSATTSLRKLRSSHLTRTQAPNGDVTPTNKKTISSSVDSSNFGSGDVGDLLRHRALSASMNSLGGLSHTSNSSTITHSGIDTVNMSSADLCQLGMENLALAISYWEDAVMKLSYLDDQQGVLAIPDSDTADLQHKLENLLDLAYRMQDNYERMCERQVEHIALESALAVFADMDKDRSFDEDSSDQESFVSATDMAHLTDLDFNRDILHHVPLYEAGMLELKYGNVPCRTI
ncbi:unnamed protein product, partial [Candidula unifasciata]